MTWTSLSLATVSLALLAQSAFAEITCRSGYQEEYDESGDIVCIPLADGPPIPPKAPCPQSSKESIKRETERQSESLHRAEKEWTFFKNRTLNDSARLSQLVASITRNVDPAMNAHRLDLATSYWALHKTYSDFSKGGFNTIRDVTTNCNESLNRLRSLLNACEDDLDAWEIANANYSRCSNLDTNLKSAKIHTKVEEYKVLAENAASVACAGSNCKGDYRDGEETGGASTGGRDPEFASGGGIAPDGSSLNTSSGSSGSSYSSAPYDSGAGSENAEGTDSGGGLGRPNQAETNTLMGAASSLLTAFMQNGKPQSMEPAQLDAGDCRRPENANSLTCRCQRAWTPDCSSVGAGGGAISFASSGIPSTGGASFKKGTAGGARDKISLGSENPSFEVPQRQGDLADPSSMGGYSGGGGFSPPPANFIPDAPKGRSGSSLSANILMGVSRGNPMSGSNAYRPSGRSRSAAESNPEGLPGYYLNRGATPDLRQFLPAGAPRPHATARGLSGLTGSEASREGMHLSNANLFRAISQRYRQIEVSLYP